MAKEIHKNLNGLMQYEPAKPYLQDIVGFGSHKGLEKTRYVNDKQITDHYAIIPTGQGTGGLKGLPNLSQKVYDVIVRRFLSIFYPPAVYQKVAIVTKMKEESFFSSFKVLAEEGYLKVAGVPGKKSDGEDTDAAFFAKIQGLKKGMTLPVQSLDIKEGKTSPPKRYNSGSLILAMENAGQLIEDEELRAQIKGSGIGTSATRGEILKKLFNNKYLALNKKTQIVTPTMLGEMIYDVVDHSIRPLLNPELTASWEKGLTYVRLGGSIGTLVNGAGLAMATMDAIKQAGAEPANFLDAGGGASEETVAAGFSIMLSDPHVRGILINIFGGILRCDIVAHGIVNAARKLDIAVPLVVRLEGTNVAEGRRILRESGLRFHTASSMSEAARLIVGLAAESPQEAGV